MYTKNFNHNNDIYLYVVERNAVNNNDNNQKNAHLDIKIRKTSKKIDFLN